MQNNFWEEQRMEDPLLRFHEEQMAKLDMPEWIKEIECPFCNKEIPLRSIRNIQLCLNTRNFGEVAIEVFCDDCKKMDTLYFRTEMNHIADFISCLRGDYSMPPKGVIEEDMYKMNYNNVMVKMITAKREANNDTV